MKRIQAAIIAVLLIVASSSSLLARVVYDMGLCPNNNTWIVVTTIDDQTGRVIAMRGTNCDGVTWTGHCTFVPITTDPNRPSMFYHPGENGDWLRYNVNNYGEVTEMWGRDLSGEYFDLAIIGIL